jgi:hypothetical protein
VLEYSARAIRQKEERKGIQMEKEEIKLFLFSDDIILYLKDPKDSTKPLLDLINTFGKVAEYNIKKLVVFLYSNNKLAEKN